MDFSYDAVVSHCSPSFSYALAGIRITTNRAIPEWEPTVSTEGEISILFGCPTISQLSENPSPILEVWVPLPSVDQPQASIRQDGRVVIIGEPLPSPGDSAAQIRRVLPFAAALQGKIILHASAIEYTGKVFAFIGASLAGKSTLAKQLERLSFPLLADDLLLCQSGKERVEIPLAASRIRPSAQPVLYAVYFLSREKRLIVPHYQPLSKKACLQQLIRHGFGELPAAQIWAVQFLMYHQIAEQVAAFQLCIPDDMGKLEETASDLKTHMVDFLAKESSSY